MKSFKEGAPGRLLIMLNINAEAGRRLGQVVVNMTATSNSPIVISTGDGMRVGDILIAPAIKEARRLKLSGDNHETELAPCKHRGTASLKTRRNSRK